MTSHFHILGPGSIGLLWAAYLRMAGHKVTLISHHAPPYPEHIKLTDLNQQIHDLPIQCVLNQTVQNIDCLLICTKAWQTGEALFELQHAIKTDTRLVLMQNGMANLDFLKHHFATNFLYAASTTEGALRSGDFSVAHTGQGQTKIGSLNHAPTLNIACQLNIQQSHDIYADLWLKLLINCAINPLTAIYNCKNGDLSRPEYWPMAQELLKEAVDTANACQQNFVYAEIEQHVLQVIKSTATNSSSMREDVLAKRRTEIDAINAYIVEQAARIGIQTPANQAIVQHIKRLSYAKH